jgi:hypothetical protein
MTLRSKERLACECGHEGYLKCSENDQPYSSMWESYSLEGFMGGTLTITSENERPASIVAALHPTCPKCGRAGKVK